MNLGFHESAVISVTEPLGADLTEKLDSTLREHSSWRYTCTKIHDGYLLKPVFTWWSTMIRNSFVPEVMLTIPRQETQTRLKLQGRPIKAVRGFMGIWFGALALFELMLLIYAITSKLENAYALLIPLGMAMFGYLLCKISGLLTFRAVVNAIRKGFP